MTDHGPVMMIYGIKNCGTMKKARVWLEDQGIAYHFHDYKTAGLSADLLHSWITLVGWESLLNRSGTTFRKLPEEDRIGLTEKKALALMLAQPSMVKRPVLAAGTLILVGFTPDLYAKTLAV